MAFIPAMKRWHTKKRARSSGAQPAWNTPEPKSSPSESIQRSLRKLWSLQRIQTSPVREDAWASLPETSEPESSAAQPEYSASLAETSEPESSAVHSEYSASMYALIRITDSIDSANADLYLDWKRSNPHARRKTMSGLIGHVRSGMKHAFESSAEEPAQAGIPLDVLFGWVLEKCNQHNENIEDAKAMLRKLAEDAHYLFRIECFIRHVDVMPNLGAEAQVDKLALNQCERLCFEEMSRTKDALKTIATNSNFDTKSWLHDRS